MKFHLLGGLYNLMNKLSWIG